MHRWESLSFEGASTPTVVTAYLYPTNLVEPASHTVTASLTYQQLTAE